MLNLLRDKVPTLICLLLLLSPLFSFAQTKSPSEFLKYSLGERFTPHHKIVAYFKHLKDENPNNIQLEVYGETNELRPLFVAYVGSKEKISQLELIRKNNLIRAGVLKEKTSLPNDNTAITWFSYNVHGNETSSSEVAMKVAYKLVHDLKENKNSDWAENTLLVIDPCLNPDGRDRYVNWFNQKMNKIPNSNPQVEEHTEPWPSGRVNHYQFDLNRDWAWLTQKESMARVKLYNSWLPQVHVDFHEQHPNDPYYFAPAAKPFHEVINNHQKEIQAKFGEENTKTFDNNGWLYFTGEIFDMLYPGYGDTYPVFNGAVGMTYELAGHGVAGRTIDTKNGKKLTLADRIEHHFSTSITTLNTSSSLNSELLDYFTEFFKTKALENEKYQSFVIRESNEAYKLDELKDFLDVHGIIYKNPSKSKNYKAFSFLENKETNYTINTSDLVIDLSQPKSKLVKSLFEPDTFLEDSLTYDLTAWAIPYTRGLEAFALETKIPTKEYTEPINKNHNKEINNQTVPYAYAIPWTSMESARFLADLEQKNVKVRFSTKEFKHRNGKSFNAGSILITKADNNVNFHKVVDSIVQDHNIEAFRLNTGRTISGKDLGSSSMALITKPKIATISGKGINENFFGHLWYYFEQKLGYPIHILNKDNFSVSKLKQFNTLILSEGNYNSIFADQAVEELRKWVNNGGKIISLGSATNFLAKNNFFDTVAKSESKKVHKASDFVKPTYGNRERESVSEFLFGAIYNVTLDQTHPLAFGYGKKYYSLKTSPVACNYLSDGWNVGTVQKKTDLYSGFVGSKVKNKMTESLTFGIQPIGKGSIVMFVDNPIFRAFWNNGDLLLSNAVFFVGND